MAILQIKSVDAIKKYKLHVLFNDGTEGIYDAGHLSGKGVFKAWDIKNNFEKVFISPESGAITWPGEIDIDTIKVYSTIKGISTEYFLKSQQHAAYL